jgi:hypothetical protein
MKDFERLLNNLNKLDINDIFFSLWDDNKVQNFIIELNTEGKPTSQLYELGVDSEGDSIGEYSPYTIQFKVDKGQRFDHITLKDTGDFYETFKVNPSKKGFEIVANPNKDDDNLFEIYGKEIVGLTKDNQKLLLAFVETDFNKELEKRIFQ